MGISLFLKKITYTGHNTTEGKYAIEFVRQTRQDLKFEDITFNGIYGVMEANNDLLTQIKIFYNNNGNVKIEVNLSVLNKLSDNITFQAFKNFSSINGLNFSVPKRTLISDTLIELASLHVNANDCGAEQSNGYNQYKAVLLFPLQPKVLY